MVKLLSMIPGFLKSIVKFGYYIIGKKRMSKLV